MSMIKDVHCNCNEIMIDILSKSKLDSIKCKYKISIMIPISAHWYYLCTFLILEKSCVRIEFEGKYKV
jgi:hypothetical protein